MRARLLKPMHRGQLPALRCRHARVDGLQRLSGRLALPQAGTPSPSCRRPGANPRPWTKISMGTRAHTTPIAPTRRPSSAPRSALRAALRVTGHRSWRSHTTRWPSPGHPPNNFTHTSLTRPDCTDKRNSEVVRIRDGAPRRRAVRDWRRAGKRQLQHDRPASVVLRACRAMILPVRPRADLADLPYTFTQDPLLPEQFIKAMSARGLELTGQELGNLHRVGLLVPFVPVRCSRARLQRGSREPWVWHMVAWNPTLPQTIAEARSDGLLYDPPTSASSPATAGNDRLTAARSRAVSSSTRHLRRSIRGWSSRLAHLWWRGRKGGAESIFALRACSESSGLPGLGSSAMLWWPLRLWRRCICRRCSAHSGWNPEPTPTSSRDGDTAGQQSSCSTGWPSSRSG